MSYALLACPVEPKSFRNFTLHSLWEAHPNCNKKMFPCTPFLSHWLALQKGSISRGDFEYLEPPRGTQLGTELPFDPRRFSPSLALYYTPSASFTLRKPDVFKEEGTQSFQNTAETGLPDWWALFLNHLGRWGTCMLTGRLGQVSVRAEIGAQIQPTCAVQEQMVFYSVY